MRTVTGCLRPTKADNLPTLAEYPACWTSSQKSHTVASMPRAKKLGHLLTPLSPVHRVGTHDISNRDTHLYPPHKNSSVHLMTTTTEMRQITDGKRSGWTTLRDSVLSSPTPAPNPWEWPSQEQRGCGLTAYAPVPGVSTPAYIMGMSSSAAREYGAGKQTVDRVALHCPIHRPLHWSTRPDGSGCWDSRMNAQLLTWDLVRPSSGLKNSLKRWRRIQIT